MHSYDASVSVYKIDSLQKADEMSIQNYLLLSSDLVGKIQQPQSYFDQKNDNRIIDMDNLMLTKGWRKFSPFVSEIKSGSTYLPELDGSLITGSLFDKTSNLPANETPVYLSVPSKNTQFKSTNTDKNGRFVFQYKALINDGQVIAQAGDLNKSTNYTNNYKIEIDNPFIGKNIPMVLTEPVINNKLPATTIASLYKNEQVQTYFTPQQKSLFQKVNTDTTAFYYTPDRTYFLDDYARFTTLEEVIREYVNPVTLVKEKGKYQLYVYDEAYKRFFDQKPLILLDGVIVKDIDKFFEYDPLKIRKLEIVSRLYYYGNISYNGILNFTTYSGKLESFELEPNSIVLDYKGLQSKRIFKAPVYETEAQIESRLPDFRHLLYWNPDIKIASNSKLSFYTSDVKGNYLLSIQGINKEGKILDKQIPFEVR
jgi:hypothetical protein